MRIPLLPDLRQALRQALRRPAASVVPLLTLAVGIGAATAVFSVVNGVLLRPLPYAEPGRLVNVWNDIGEGATAQSLPAVSAHDWRYYREHATRFVDFGAAVGGGELGATGIVGGEGAAPERVTLGGVSANFFPLLGVRPLLGRGFTPEDDVPGAPRTVVLSHADGLRRFGGDPAVVGTRLEVDAVPRTIVGVLPPSFRLLHPAETYMLRDSDVWTPLQLDWGDTTSRRNSFTVYTVIGRLKPGATLAEAQADLDAVARGLRTVNAEYATTPLRIRAVPLHLDVVKSVRPALLVLLAAVGLLVLIACANVANLLLARASRREREITIRLAVGASRGQIVRQLLAESALLTTAAGAVGVAIAAAALWYLAHLGPTTLPRLADVAIDWRVLAFVAALLLAAATLSGLAPALWAARRGVHGALAGARVANQGGQPLLRNALIVGEVALSAVLLVGAGLVLRSFLRLEAVRPGFVADGALTFHVALPRHAYRTFDTRRAFTRGLAERLRAVPGVTAVGATSNLPLTGQGPTAWYAFEGRPEGWQHLHAERLSVTPGWFAAAGTRIVAGRAFTDADDGSGAPVVIVDALIARAGWPDGSAVGKRLQVAPPGAPNAWATIVGVAEHVRSEELREDGLPQLYWPHAARSMPNMTGVLRTPLPPERLAAAARRAVSAADPSLPVTNVAPLARYLAVAMEQARFTLVLMQVVAALSLFLATVGLYGVISFVVAQRTREFGVRLALGESPARLRRRVVSRGMRVVAASAALGAVAALLVAGALRALLYEVSPYDPAIFGGVVAFLLAVGAAACWVPARRASRADPLVALRSD